MWNFGLDGRRVAQQDLDYFEGKLDATQRWSVWLSELKRDSDGPLNIWN